MTAVVTALAVGGVLILVVTATRPAHRFEARRTAHGATVRHGRTVSDGLRHA